MHPDDESRIINYDPGSEMVSLPGRTEPTSTQREYEDSALYAVPNRRHFNPDPVYEAVPFAEKTPTSDGDEKAPSEVPEKVMPHDDAKPLVATTTATGTTTVHGNGEKYEPATPVPIEVQNEPMYATVMPKHKRATAKPFAADGDESDSD